MTYSPELQAKLDEMMKMKAALDQLMAETEEQRKKEEEEARNAKPLKILVAKMVDDYVYISNDYDDRLLVGLRATPNRGYSHNYNTFPVPMFRVFIEWLVKQEFPYILTYAEGLEEEIANWQPPPKYRIDYEDTKLAIKMLPGVNQSIITSIPTARRYADEYWRISHANAWRVALALKEEPSIIWDAKALALAMDQLEQRDKIDKSIEIDEPLGIELNGMILKPYQVKAVRFALATGGRCLIADEMGLGKTIEAIATTEVLRKEGKVKSALIICPVSFILNIVNEVLKCTGRQPYVLYGSKPTAGLVRTYLERSFDYYIIGYDSIGERVVHFDEKTGKEEDVFPWLDVLRLSPPDMLICDEIHYIKNVESNRSKAVRQFKTKYQLGLSGSLMPNRPRELHTPIAWINSEIAGEYEPFVGRYEADYGKGIRNVRELQETLKGIMIRRTKKEVMPDLEGINRIIHWHELSPQGKVRYNKIVEGLMTILKNGDLSDSHVVTNILEQLLRMKQICAEDKIDTAVELAIKAHTENQTDWTKVIIFSQFVHSPPMIEAMSKRLGDESLWFHGDVDRTERMDIIREFQTNPKYNYLVAGVKSASESFTITAAGACIFTDLDWTPKTHEQAEGRSYGRANDPHTIDSYYIVASRTVEDTLIMPTLQSKMANSKTIIDGTEDARADMGSILNEVLHALKTGGVKMV